jgi:TRAP-type C4-dicarboxylate transport system substrate-binding protein
MLIGYAGGGLRNIFINKPMGSLAEIKGLKVRVQGAPIWSKTFSAVGMSPTVIAYNESTTPSRTTSSAPARMRPRASSR